MAQTLLQNAGCIFIFGGEPGAVVEDDVYRCGRAPCSPSVQTAAMTLIWSGRGLKANSESGREMLAPSSMGGWLSKSVSQTFFAFLAGCEEEEISKTTAQTGLLLRFVTVQVGRFSPVGWISTRNSGRSVARCG